MKKLILLLVLGIGLSPAFGQGQQVTLSGQAQVSLLTVDQWDQLWAAFGHSSLRVYDPVTGIDKAYDYGVFDFNDPAFYTNFTKGLLRYRVAARPFHQFVGIYQRHGRWVKESVLDLDSADVQAIFDYVEWNAKEENAYYMYHYFYDNCATRLIDIFENTLGDRVQFNSDHLTEPTSIRQLVHDYTYMDPFAQFGIDLVLGSSIDQVATPREVAFLPDYTKLAFENADYKGADSAEWRGLVVDEIAILDLPSLRDREFSFAFTPGRIMWLFCIMGLFITAGRNKLAGLGRVYDFLLFFVLGVIGLVVAFMWFGTDHVNATNNFNLMWAWPTHLVLAFFLLRRTPNPKVQRYFRIVAIFLVLVLALWWLWPQAMPVAIIPLLIAAVIRGARFGFLG